MNYADKEPIINSHGSDGVCPVHKKSVGRPKTGRETKTKRTITILPSVYDAAAKIARTEHKAMSELIEELLAEFIEKNNIVIGSKNTK